MCLNYKRIIFIFFQFAPARFPRAVLLFFLLSDAVAHGFIVLLKKSISYLMNIMYKHIFLNFGVISFMNKEMVSFVQLHTYKFGLLYIIYLYKFGAHLGFPYHITLTCLCNNIVRYTINDY